MKLDKFKAFNRKLSISRSFPSFRCKYKIQILFFLFESLDVMLKLFG